MNILVTGGAGFIGSNIVDRLISEGNKVVVVDDLSTGKKENLNPKAKFYNLDIVKDGLKELIKKEKIQLVNHHAAQIDLRLSVNLPAADAKINIIGSINLFEAAVGTDVKTIIFSSTGGAVYGEQAVLPASETQPAYPVSPYGISKLTVEKYLYYYKKVYGIDYVILRYSNVYGPRQNSRGEAGVIAIFIEKMLKSERPVINGAGRKTRDFIYVDDVVEANILALRYGKSEIFNVGTGVETDIYTIWEKLKDLTGYKGAIFHGPEKKGEQERSSVDNASIKRALGWKQGYDIDSGLKKTVDWFKQNLY